jgi:hypothetical protein
MARRPQLISTSRHITQGVVDVVSESWDADSKSLSGISRVVAGDPYELRIAKPASGDWRLVATTVGESVDASIKLVREEAAGWRVRIDSPTNQELQWVVRFD